MKTAWVGIVVSDVEGAFNFLHDRTAASSDHLGGALWYSPPLPIHDREDAFDAPLFLCHGDDQGLSVYSPDCGGVEEFERRVVRAIGLDCVIDDNGPAAEQQPPSFWTPRPKVPPQVLFRAVEFTYDDGNGYRGIASITRGGEIDSRSARGYEVLEEQGFGQWATVGPQGGEDRVFYATEEFLRLADRPTQHLAGEHWRNFDSPIGERS